MNGFRGAHQVFPGLVQPPPPAPPPRPRRFFRIPRKPGNLRCFGVAFLTYLVGFYPTFLYALPQDGTVQAGSVTLTQPSANELTLRQTTDKAIIDWRSFGIGSQEGVDFQLPSVDGVTLNRVTGEEPSEIHGRLTSNGHLMLINPNGILFGEGARVDVHGLVATTTDIRNEDFLAGRYRFGVPSASGGWIENRGRITAAEGGLVALVAPGVVNAGVIEARLGRVHLASGQTFTLDLYGDQLVNLGVDSEVVGSVTGWNGETRQALLSNSGKILADGGVVRLDVRAARTALDRVINMDGILQARSVQEKNGAILLTGGPAGEVRVSGTLDASGPGPGETGGTVQVLGERVGLYEFGSIDVSGDAGGGRVYFGGDFQGQGALPTARETYIGPDTTVYADAITSGAGGRAIFWADRRNRFLGRLWARGGRESGEGGFVEISGREELYFDGRVDTRAANGKSGTLLLDPEDLLIQNGSGSASGAVTFEHTLEAVSSTTNIDLLADNSITLENLSDNLLDLSQTSGHSVTFTATKGRIDFLGADDTLRTNGGDIRLDAGTVLNIGSLESGGGDITVKGQDLILLSGAALNSGSGDTRVLASKVGTSGGIIGLAGSGVTLSTLCGGSACDLTLDSDELRRITANRLIVGDTTNGDIYVNGLASADTANLAGGVELNVTAHVSGSSGQIHFRGGGSTFDSLTAQAVNGINIDADLTTTQGDLVLEGDSDNTADPTKPDINTLAFADGVTLNSAGNLTLDSTTQGLSAAGSLNLTAAQGLTVNDALTSAGNLTLTAAQGLTLNRDVTSGGSLTLEADSDNTGSSSDKLTLGSGVSLTTTGGGLTLNATSGGIEGLGAATLTSSQGLSVEDPFTAAGALTLSAANGLIVNADVTASGHLFLEGDRGDVSQGTDSITFASGLTLASTGGMVSLDATHGGLSAPAALTVNAAEGIVVNDSLTTGGNTVFDADTDDDGSGTLTVVSGKTVSTGNNALSLTADDIVLDGALDSGTAAISLAVSDGESMGLGLASGFGMNLSAAELASLTETGLTLSGGNITVAAGQTVGSSGKLTIGSSGTTIAGQGALTLQGEDGLAIRSSVTAAGDLTLDGDADNAADGDDRLTLASGVSLTSTAGRVSLDATQGSLSAAGGLTMSATNGLSILENLTTAGTTTLNADTDGDGTGSFSLASGKTLSTGGNPLALTTADATFAGSLDSGTATTSFEGSQSGNTIGLGDAAGDLSLSSAELGRITAGGLLLGGSTNGGITVDNVAASFDTVTLKATGSGGSVSFSGNASSFNALTVNAENGITVSQTLTTAGTTAFHADSDGDGTGAFTVAAGQGVTTGNNPLSVTAGSLGLNGTLDAGTAEAGLEVSRAGATLGLGSGVTCGGSACDLTLTPTQLAQITSGRLTLGGGTNGGITVDALTAANPVTLTATRSGSGVTFGDTASTFTSLTVNAGSGGVDFGADLTASGTLAVTSVGSITDTGTLAVTGPSSFTATGTDQAIALDSAANSFGGTVTLNTTGTGGHATLVSGGGLSLGTSAIGGNLSVTAGGGLGVDGTQTAGGTLALTAEGKITLTGGLVTSSASDSAVTLTSNTGGVEDGDSDDSLDIDAPDGGLVADTVTGFGTDLNPVETRVRALDLDNTTSGDVHVFESDSLHVTKIDQQADPGDVTVSFSGTLTGQANANAAHGTVSFERRDFTNQVIAGTGKTLGQLSVDNTVNTAVNVETRFSVFDKTPEFDGKTVAQGLKGSVSTPFVVNVFAEEFELFEVGEEARGTYEGLQGFKEFWGALSRENTEVVRRTLRSRDQDEARRKKPAPDRQRSSLSKEDETASRPPSEDGGWAFLKGWLGAFR